MCETPNRTGRERTAECKRAADDPDSKQTQRNLEPLLRHRGADIGRVIRGIDDRQSRTDGQPV